MKKFNLTFCCLLLVITFSNAQDQYGFVSTSDFTTSIDSNNFDMCEPPGFGISIPISKVSSYNRIAFNMYKREIGSEKWEPFQGKWASYKIAEFKSTDGKTLNCAVMDPDLHCVYYNYDMCNPGKSDWHSKHEHYIEIYSMKPTGELEEYYDEISNSWKKRKLYKTDKLIGKSEIFRFVK
jgi:hypothetical protein